MAIKNQKETRETFNSSELEHLLKAVISKDRGGKIIHFYDVTYSLENFETGYGSLQYCPNSSLLKIYEFFPKRNLPHMKSGNGFGTLAHVKTLQAFFSKVEPSPLLKLVVIGPSKEYQPMLEKSGYYDRVPLQDHLQQAVNYANNRFGFTLKSPFA